MLEWLDRYMAKFAQTDHIRREEHARRQEEASPAHEEAGPCLKPSHIPVLDVHA